MNASKQNYLLSYPKSGNTWVRYCVEVLSEKPTNFTKKNRNQTIALHCKHIDININDEIILIKTHNFSDNKFKSSFDKDRLIFLIRNPFEVLSRYDSEKYKNPLNIRLDMFMHLIEIYDHWKSDKLLIYYEDLLLQPKICLKQILNILNIDSVRLNNFMDNYNFHKNQSIIYYNNHVDRSITNGNCNNLEYYSNKKNNQNSFIKKELESTYKDFFDKYLLRYKRI